MRWRLQGRRLEGGPCMRWQFAGSPVERRPVDAMPLTGSPVGAARGCDGRFAAGLTGAARSKNAGLSPATSSESQNITECDFCQHKMSRNVLTGGAVCARLGSSQKVTIGGISKVKTSGMRRWLPHPGDFPGARAIFLQVMSRIVNISMDCGEAELMYWNDEKISDHGETLVVTLLRRIEDLQLTASGCQQELERTQRALEAVRAELAALKGGAA